MLAKPVPEETPRQVIDDNNTTTWIPDPEPSQPHTAVPQPSSPKLLRNHQLQVQLQSQVNLNQATRQHLLFLHHQLIQVRPILKSNRELS